PKLVRDLLRQLHREPEAGRHRRCPARPGGALVRTIEGGIDLDRIEAGGVSRQRAFAFAEQRRVAARMDQPAHPILILRAGVRPMAVPAFRTRAVSGAGRDQLAKPADGLSPPAGPPRAGPPRPSPA